MTGKDTIKTIGLFLGIAAAVLLVIIFFWVIVIGLVFLSCIILGVVLIVLAALTILFLFAIPYYAVKKKPEVQQCSSYNLDEVKDKDDLKK